MRTGFALAIGAAAGIAVGAGVTLRWFAPDSSIAGSSVRLEPAASPFRARSASPQPRVGEAAAPREGFTAARAEIYDLAAAANRTQLEELVRSTAAEASTGRE